MRGILLVLGVFCFSLTSIQSSAFCSKEPSLKSLTEAGSSLTNVPDALALQNLNFGNEYGRLNYDDLKILVWNLHKGEDAAVYDDLKTLSQNADLTLTQEAYLNEDFEKFFCANNDTFWEMATSFWDSDVTMTGVATGSKQVPSYITFLRSPDTEPFVDTHKMSLAHIYDIPDSQEKLLVINIHGINFTGDASFRRQITVIVEMIVNHTGPVIFAGDFNARNKSRTEYLTEILKTYGLEEVDTGYDPHNAWGFLPFDHLFQRGFDVISAKAFEEVETSDHKPLYFELKLKR